MLAAISITLGFAIIGAFVLMCRCVPLLRSLSDATGVQRVADWISRRRMVFFGASGFFVLLWLSSTWYDIGWGTAAPDYCLLSRGLLIVMLRGRYRDGMHWSERDWDVICRWRESPTLEIDFDWTLFELGIGLPLWLVGFWIAMIPLAPQIQAWITRKQADAGYCASCGYSLAGLGSATCPECGHRNEAS